MYTQVQRVACLPCPGSYNCFILPLSMPAQHNTYLLVAQLLLQLQLPNHALVDAPNLLRMEHARAGSQSQAGQQHSPAHRPTACTWAGRAPPRPDALAHRHKEPGLTLTEACGTTAQISLKVRALPVWRHARNTMAASTAAWLLFLMDLALS